MNKLTPIAIESFKQAIGPFAKFNFTTGRTAVPFVLPPYYTDEHTVPEEAAEWLGFKAGIEACRMFRERVMTGQWIGDATEPFIMGRETFDEEKDAGSPVGDPIDTFIQGGDSLFEYLCPRGTFFGGPKSVDVEFDLDLIVSDGRMQVNTWLKLTIHPNQGRFVA